jgi:hypothetical protein
MKRGVIFLLILLIVIIGGSIFLNVNLDKKRVTGEITTQAVNLNVSVVQPPPIINILSPLNQTYLTNNILLNFSSTFANNFWYKLDSGANTTITSPTYFAASEGFHTLQVYANNSNSTVSSNVSFTINSTRFIIIQTEYTGTDRGSTIQFLNYTYEEIQDLSSIILENINYGKILFNEAINLTNDSDITDNQLDIDTSTNISFNRIEINTVTLPNFNKPATLTLYNLNFVNPRILKDGVLCPDSVCTLQSYSGGTLVFNVAGFSTYSSEETPEEIPSTTRSSGGGGSIDATTENFSLNQEQIAISLKQGEVKERQFIIKNLESKEINIKIENPNLPGFIILDETEFEIKSQENKTVSMQILAKENTIPGIYIGKLIISSGNLKREILISIEVESKKPLFDVRINIPDRYRYVFPEEEITIGTEIFNLGEVKRADAELEYYIKDENGFTMFSEKETIAVETRASLIKSIRLPKTLTYGNYLVYVQVRYSGQIASASQGFSIVKEKSKSNRYEHLALYLVALIVIIVLSIIVYELKRIKKTHEHYIDEITLLKSRMIKRK